MLVLTRDKNIKSDGKDQSNHYDSCNQDTDSYLITLLFDLFAPVTLNLGSLLVSLLVFKLFELILGSLVFRFFHFNV
jgi:hypothetical protein